MFSTNLAIGMPGSWEWMVILVIALLIFGRRLPEVGRSVGKTLVEFKKGMKGAENEMRKIEREAEEAAALPDSSSAQTAASPVGAAAPPQST